MLLDSCVLHFYIFTFLHFICLEFQGDAQFGRCILILADEIDRFMSGEFKNMLIKLYEKPDVTKTSMQSIHLTFSEPINLMEKFLSNINAVIF